MSPDELKTALFFGHAWRDGRQCFRDVAGYNRPHGGLLFWLAEAQKRLTRHGYSGILWASFSPTNMNRKEQQSSAHGTAVQVTELVAAAKDASLALNGAVNAELFAGNEEHEDVKEMMTILDRLDESLQPWDETSQ